LYLLSKQVIRYIALFR